MNDHPILFNAEMVRAILAGTKTQTRRPMKVQPPNGATEVYVEAVYEEWAVTYRAYPDGGSARHAICACPFGGPGDRLWVRECWGIALNDHAHDCVCYRADEGRGGEPQMMRLWRSATQQWYLEPTADPNWEPEQWCQSNHMPRWASRITLLIKRTWVERIQDISEEDAAAEGVDAMPAAPAAFTHRTAFAGLWDSIYAKRGLGWDDNPWVDAAEFELIETEKARES